MSSRQSTDFLVQQLVEQAALDGVTVSDLERRMLYFTETPGECPEDPYDLNTEFEDAYDNAEYEQRMSGLFKRAYARLKSENPESRRQWDAAVKELRKGDFYILVLCN